MESIEILIFIGIAVIAGAMLLNFMGDVPLLEFGEQIEKDLLNEKELEFRKVNELGFYEQVIEFWRQNQYSDATASTTIYLDEEGYIDKEKFFETIKKNNMCNSIQSRAYDCGTREDVYIEKIELPKVIRITYLNESIYIGEGTSTGPPNRSIQFSIVYFEGFEGNGEQVRQLELPPFDKIVMMNLRLMSGSDFNLIINDSLCNYSLVSGEVDEWDITHCGRFLEPGVNMISLEYTSTDLFRKYTAGGYLTVLYESDEQPPTTNYRLPAVDGTINYFGGFNLPQNQATRLYLDYWVGDLGGKDLFVAVGDQVVYQNTNPGSHSEYIGISGLQGTNPIRIGIDSAQSTTKEIEVPVPVDVVLITDISGSMAWDLATPYGTDNPDGIVRDCLDPWLYDMTTMKLSLAKCFGKEFVDIVLRKYRQNQIGLVAFSDEANRGTMPLTSDQADLNSAIDAYVDQRATCVSCAIFEDRKMLNNTDRTRAMVIMTDGVANVMIDGTRGEVPAQNEARDQGRLAYEEDGIHVYTIAFGDGADSTVLQDIARFENISHFAQGSDPDTLRAIYQNFAEDIAKMYSVKTRHAQGAIVDDVVPARINEGYIEIMQQPITGNKVIVRKDLYCPGEFYLPSTVDSARLYVWGGPMWTQSVDINNQMIFDMSSYQSVYMFTGDPFVVEIPANVLDDYNTVSVSLSDVEAENLLCGESTVEYVYPVSGTFSQSIGCNWKILFPGGFKEMTIPSDYIGDRECEYSKEMISYRKNDLYQAGVGDLLRELDSDSNGVVDNPVDEILVIGGFS